MYPLSVLSWVALCLVCLAAGLIFGNVALLAAAVFLLLVVIIATAPRPPAQVLVERSVPREICWAGDVLDVERKVTIRGGMGAIFVHDSLPPEVEVVEGNNLRVLWTWTGSGTYDLSYRARFVQRGELVLPPTTWTAQAPFGIRRHRATLATPPIRIAVAPRIRGITRLNEVRAATRQPRYQDDLSQTGTSNSEFRELRPYAPGDPIKLINWKASSRGSRSDNLPLVNELEPEGRKAVWIFLDLANYMDVGTPLDSPMENTVEAAGSLAQFYLSKGSSIGAYAYNSYGGEGELLSPDSGRKQFQRLTQMLVGLKPGLPRQDLLQAVEWCKGFLMRLQPEVFIITRLDVFYPRPGESSESLDRLTAAVKRLTALRRRARRPGRVRVVHVSPRESIPESGTAAETASLSLWESRALSAELRRCGAEVILWEPSREDFISLLVRHIHAYR